MGESCRRIVLFFLVLARVAPAWAEEETRPLEKTHAGLRMRVVLPKVQEPIVLASVGNALQFRVEFTNLTNKTIFLPPQDRALRVHVVHAETGLTGGRTVWPPPEKKHLVELAPGATHAMKVEIEPCYSGPARLEIRFGSSSRVISEYVMVYQEDPANPGTRYGHRRRREIELPGLWQGWMTVAARLNIHKGVGYGEGNLEGVRFLAGAVDRLLHGESELLDRLELLSRLGDYDRTERVTNVFLERLRARNVHLLEEIECTKQLVLAARRGYGFRAIPKLIELAADTDKDSLVRILALEAAALAIRRRVRADEGDCVFLLAVPERWQTDAKALLQELASLPQTPLGRRAAEILEKGKGDD